MTLFLVTNSLGNTTLKFSQTYISSNSDSDTATYLDSMSIVMEKTVLVTTFHVTPLQKCGMILQNNSRLYVSVMKPY